MARIAAAVEVTGSRQQGDVVCIQLDEAHYYQAYFGALSIGGPLDAPNEIATGSVVSSRAYGTYADFVYREVQS